MNSSTSRSKHLFAILLGSLIVSYGIGAAYTIWVNPEIRFWKKAYSVKLAHARELDATGKPKTVFVGGSSCAFQIDTDRLSDRFDIPSVNMGMHAGMGAKVVTALAVQTLKPGDRLILNIEPDLLTREKQLTPLGLQFLAATKNLFILSPLFSSDPSATLTDIMLSLRPGLRNTVTMLGKLFLGRPLYRYHPSDIHRTGCLSTSEKGAVAVRDVGVLQLSEESKQWLSKTHTSLKERNIDLRYLLPWMCFTHDAVPAARKSLQNFAEQVEVFVSLLQDGRHGVDIQLKDFADTALHTTHDGAKRRTDLLAKVLMKCQDSAMPTSNAP